MVLILKGIILIGDLSTNEDTKNVDKNLLKALASYYGNAILGETFEFENSLIDYFKEHYKEIMGDHYKDFLIKFSEGGSENTEEGDLFKIARQFVIDTTSFEDHFGSNLVIKDGLIYEENNGLNIIYATDKAINGIIESLYGSSLYYKHLAKENTLESSDAANLQRSFVEYANQNGIELANTNQILKTKKRFVKRKTKVETQGNIVDFQKQSC